MPTQAEVQLMIYANDTKLRKDLARINRRVKSSFQGMNRSATNLFKGIAAYAGLRAVSSGIRDTTKAWSDFEVGLANVRAKTGALKKEMGPLRAEILSVAKATIYDPGQAAEGAGFLAQAGLKMEAIKNALKPSLDLAAATRETAQNSADILTNVASPLNLLHKKGLQRTSDVLAKTTAIFNVDLQELGESAKYAAPSFAALGLSLEGGLGLIGALGSGGIKGSMAGTFFRQAETALLSAKQMDDAGEIMEGTLDNQGKALENLGVKLKDAEGNFRGVEAVLEDIAGFSCWLTRL